MSLFRPRFFEVPFQMEDGLKWLTEASGLTSERLTELMNLGAIYYNRQRLFQNKSFEKGATLKIYPDPKRYPGPWDLPILHENDDLVVVDKPSRLPSIPTPGNAFENAFSLVAKSKGQFLYPIHRLDEGTCGVLMLGKTKKSVHDYQAARADERITKIYRGLSAAPPPLGSHVHWMQKDVGRMRITENEAEGQRAEMHVKEVKRVGSYYLSLIQLITGRTHQIRCQMEHLGCPLIGDAIYGGEASPDNQLKLQAYQVIWDQLVFTSKYQIVEAPE